MKKQTSLSVQWPLIAMLLGAILLAVFASSFAGSGSLLGKFKPRTPVACTDGKVGTLTFTRGGGQVRVYGVPNGLLSGKIPLSYSFWIKSNDKNADIISKISAEGVGGRVGLQDGKLVFGLQGQSSALEVISATAVSDNKIHHIAVTYDGGLKATGVKMYIDGKEISTLAKSDLNAEIQNEWGNLLLGGRKSQRFNGSIQELRAYASILNPADVATLVTGGSIAPNMMAHWTFNDVDQRQFNDEVFGLQGKMEGPVIRTCEKAAWQR
jgi:hypothetical protein